VAIAIILYCADETVMMVDGFSRPTSAVARREALLLVELGRSAEARAGLRHVVKELRRAGFSSGRVAGIEFASLASTSGRVVTDKDGRRRVVAPAPRRRDDKRRCAKQRRFELKWLQRRLRMAMARVRIWRWLRRCLAARAVARAAPLVAGSSPADVAMPEAAVRLRGRAADASLETRLVRPRQS